MKQMLCCCSLQLTPLLRYRSIIHFLKLSVLIYKVQSEITRYSDRFDRAWRRFSDRTSSKFPSNSLRSINQAKLIFPTETSRRQQSNRNSPPAIHRHQLESKFLMFYKVKSLGLIRNLKFRWIHRRRTAQN